MPITVDLADLPDFKFRKNLIVAATKLLSWILSDNECQIKLFNYLRHTNGYPSVISLIIT